MKVWAVTILLDEHEMVREWLDWHIKIGIDRVVFYDNGSSHPYTNEIGDYLESGYVTIVDWPSKALTRQINAFKHFLDNFPEPEDYFFGFDVDEYLVLEKHNSIHELIDAYSDYAGISISWNIMNSSGHILKPSGGVVENYTQSVDPIRTNHNFKSLGRCDRISWFPDVHRFIPKHPYELVNVYGKPVWDSNLETTKDIAYLNHYLTRSAEDYLNKLRRGNITPGIRKLAGWIDYNKEYEKEFLDYVDGKTEFDFPTTQSSADLRRIELEEDYGLMLERLEFLVHADLQHSEFLNAIMFEASMLTQMHINTWDKWEDIEFCEKCSEGVNVLLGATERIPQSTPNYRQLIINSLLSIPLPFPRKEDQYENAFFS